MLISVIVPIYKVEKYIVQCVDSIINQSFKELEIILVDDGSPDCCPEICDQYAEKDSRIKVIHKANDGLLNARKTGLEAATGDYVTFVDGDDYIDADMYLKAAKTIERYNPDCVITQFHFAFVDSNEPSDYALDGEFYNRQQLESDVFPKMLFNGRYYKFGIYPNCWSKLFKREIIQKYLPVSDGRIRLGEDIAFVYPCLMDCQSIAFVDEPLYYYRQNPESMTATYDASLKQTYLLPYSAVNNASKALSVDLSRQLPYYLLYLTNFVIRNEFSNTEKDKDFFVTLLNNFTENADAGALDYKYLPLHTKLLAFSLKTKSVPVLKLYSKLLSKFIR